MHRLILGLIAWLSLSLLAYAQTVLPPVGPPGGIACAYNSALPTIISGNVAWIQCDSHGQLLISGSGGSGLAVTAASGAYVDGSIVTLGTKADTAWVSGSGTLISIAKTIATNTGTSVPAGTNNIGLITPAPTNSASAYHAATITASDQTIVTASTAIVMLDLRNLSPTATVCINLGATATISGTQCTAGEISVAPLGNVYWSGNYVPPDAVHAIASAASVPFTYGAK